MTQTTSEDGGADAEPARDAQRPLLVVADTNILVSNNLLQTASGSTLIDLIIRAKGHILLPEVVELELKNVLGQRLVEGAEKAAGHIKGLEAIIRRDLFKPPDAKELSAAIDERLSELDPLIQRAPFTLDVARAALTRVIEGRPPSGSNNEQFRDCCIWEHCLRLGEHYDVHLVTTDGDFYQDKKPESGLAEQLRSELSSAKATVFSYRSLSKLIDQLGPSVPPDDAEALGRRIAEVARTTLAPMADTTGFVLSELTHSRVSVTGTKGPLDLLATFDLTYLLVNKSEQDAQVRLSPELAASGSCVLSGPDRSIRDLRLDESTTRWTDLSGKEVAQRHLFLFVQALPQDRLLQAWGRDHLLPYSETRKPCR